MSQHVATRFVEQEELLRLLLCGCTLKECASQMNRHPQTIRRWASGTEFLMKLKSLSSEIYERVDRELKDTKEALLIKLEQASDEALDRLIQLARESKNEGIALKAASDILDRDGRVSKTRKMIVDEEVKHSFIDPLQLVHIAGTAREMDEYERKKLNGTVSSSDATGGIGKS